MAKRVFLTGATGLLGSHVAEKLGQAGHQVVALVRPSSPTRGFVESLAHVEIAWGELADTDLYADQLASCDAIVHCAGVVNEGRAKAVYHQVNVGDTQVLLEQALKAGRHPHFLHVSTLGVYSLGDHFGTDETVAIADTSPDPYIDSKIAAEKMVATYVDRLPVTIYRPGFMYGERDRVVLPKIVQFLRRGIFVYIGSRQNLLDNTYAGHAADALVHGLADDRTYGKTYNVTDEELVTKERFVKAITDALGMVSPKVTLPDAMARAIIEYLPWLPLTWSRYKFLGKNLEFSTTRLREELGFRTEFDFDETMARSITWFQNEVMS